METHYFAHPTAVIDNDCQIGEGTKITHLYYINRISFEQSAIIFTFAKNRHLWQRSRKLIRGANPVR